MPGTDRTYAATMIGDPTCEQCGGDHPSGDTQAGNGWILTGYPATELADGTRRQGQAEMRPCSRCRPPQFRRWRRGHFPCPRGMRGGMCSDCKREHGERTVDEEELLPVDDVRYEPSVQEEFFPT